MSVKAILTEQLKSYTKAEEDALLALKAPSGYGLGDLAPTLGDLNTVVETGFYRATSNSSHKPDNDNYSVLNIVYAKPSETNLGVVDLLIWNSTKVWFRHCSNGLWPNDWTPVVTGTRTVNNKALSSNIALSASDVGAVPTTRTVNNKALSSNIALSASDVGAAPSGYGIGTTQADSYPNNDLDLLAPTGLYRASGSTSHRPSNTSGTIINIRYNNDTTIQIYTFIKDTPSTYIRYGAIDASTQEIQWSNWNKVVYSADIENFVPNTRTINNKALSSNITLSASDVSAAPTSHASSATTYGTGTSSNYGHLKLSAATNSTSGVSDGIAATPSAVKSAYDLANGKYTKPSGGIPVSDLAVDPMVKDVDYVTAGLKTTPGTGETASDITLGTHATAEGTGVNAHGGYSHAEGFQTTASANHAHAEGRTTIASGTQSHAEGHTTTASGVRSHSEGYNTIASGADLHVSGKWNIADSTQAEIIGNGSADAARSNARTLDWNGNEVLAGSLTLGSTEIAAGGSNKVSITLNRSLAMLVSLLPAISSGSAVLNGLYYIAHTGNNTNIIINPIVALPSDYVTITAGTNTVTITNPNATYGLNYSIIYFK